MADLLALAKAISTSSSRIRAYAIEQATQHIGLRAELDLLEQRVTNLQTQPSNGAIWPSCQAHFGGDLQAMINQVPDGTQCWLEPGAYSGPFDVSHKSGLRLTGLGGTGWNERDGTVLRTSAPNQVLIRDRASTHVKHAGIELDHLVLADDHGGGTGLEVWNTNHWKVLHCSFQGRFDRAAIHAGQDQNMMFDNAYSLVLNTKWRVDGPALTADFAGVTVLGGANGGGPNSGFRLLNNSQGCWFSGGKSNHSGRMMLIEGGANTIDWGFEQYGSDTNNAYALEIVRPGAWPMEGRGNTVRGYFVDHPWGTGRHVLLGPGTMRNDIDSLFITDQPVVTDQGAGNWVRTK